MKEVITEAIIDSLKVLPFLFITFLLIEVFEHKFSNKSKKAVEKSDKLGPLIGSLLGIIPQCGFGVAATNLYVTRIISLGTLFAVYLSTSDEMLPLLIAQNAPLSLMLKILSIKFAFGLIIGYIIDLIIRNKDKPKYNICEDEHCNCHESIILASIKHTLNIFAYIIIFTFLINIIMHYGGENVLAKILLKDNILASFVTSLIGLIPNCAGSVVLTELFLNNAISFGALIGGGLTAAGVAILVLLKENKNKKENIKIILGLYLIGALGGILVEIITRII